MDIDDEIKNKVIEHIQAGEESKACALLNEKFGLSQKDANRLTDIIKADLIKNYRLNTVKSLKKREENKSIKGCFKIVGWAIVIGAVLISLGFYIEFKTVKQIENSQIVNGIIANASDPAILTYSVYGEEFLFEFSNTNNDGLFVEPGAQLEIYVDNDDPEKVLLNSDHHLWSSSRALKIVGAVPLFLGLILLFIMFLPDRKSN